MAVIVPFESPSTASIDELVTLVAADMARVNATILSRTGSEVTMIPEVANHLISSGGKRLRPMLTLAMANLTGYSGENCGAANCPRGCCGAMRRACWWATSCSARRFA